MNPSRTQLFQKVSFDDGVENFHCLVMTSGLASGSGLVSGLDKDVSGGGFVAPFGLLAGDVVADGGEEGAEVLERRDRRHRQLWLAGGEMCRGHLVGHLNRSLSSCTNYVKFSLPFAEEAWPP